MLFPRKKAYEYACATLPPHAQTFQGVKTPSGKFLPSLFLKLSPHPPLWLKERRGKGGRAKPLWKLVFINKTLFWEKAGWRRTFFNSFSLSPFFRWEEQHACHSLKKHHAKKKSDAFPPLFNHFFHVGGNGIKLENFHIHSPGAKNKKRSGNPFVDAAAIFFRTKSPLHHSLVNFSATEKKGAWKLVGFSTTWTSPPRKVYVFSRLLGFPPSKLSVGNGDLLNFSPEYYPLFSTPVFLREKKIGKNWEENSISSFPSEPVRYFEFVS